MASNGKVNAGSKPQRARNSTLRAEKERKAFEAKVRNELYAAKSPAERLASLDAAKLVAKKERAKLMKLIEAQIATAEAKPEKAKKVKQAAQP